MRLWPKRHTRVDRAAIRVGERRAGEKVLAELKASREWCDGYWPRLVHLEDRADYRERARLFRIAAAAVRKAARR